MKGKTVLHKHYMLKQLGHVVRLQWNNCCGAWVIVTNIVAHRWFSYSWWNEMVAKGIAGCWHTYGKETFYNHKSVTRFIKRFYPHHINFWVEDFNKLWSTGIEDGYPIRRK